MNMESVQAQSSLILNMSNFDYITDDVVRKFEFFCQYLRDDDADVDAAAAGSVAAINDPASNVLKTHEGGFSGFIWNFWITVINLAQQIPHDHPYQGKMVRLLAAIKRLPRPITPEAEQMEQLTSKVFWTDLPIFGVQVCETWSEGPWEKQEGHHPSNLGKGPLPSDQWTNLNAFIARIMASSVNRFDFYPLKVLRHCLEQRRKLIDLEANLPAATMWIIYAGAWIYRSSLLERIDDVTPKYEPGKEYLRKFATMFSKDRWDFWKERLQSMRHEESLSLMTRHYVEKALERMDQLAACNPACVRDEPLA